MSVFGPADSKKLVEALLGDLRLLSQESKKKNNPVKEAAESGVVRVRNISTASSESTLLTNLRAASHELLHPLALACGTRQSRLVQIGLQGIQRLVQHRILESSCSNVVVSELWRLVEAECEELRVLQTVPPMVSADLLITGNNLARCIVMCFRLNFAKDTVVINAASAAVRQIVGGVFERVIQEDGLFSGELTVVTPSGGRQSKSAPPTLRPCAADAYMLFRDLCLLINGEPPIWLLGIKEITRTLGLELLESLLKSYPGVFLKHTEIGALVKQEVCPLIIKLFSPNLKSVAVSSQHPSSKSHNQQVVTSSSQERPFFPIAMRLVRIVVVLITFYHQLLPTECEIFVSHLLKFLDTEKRTWQRVLALEAFHKLISKTDILRWLGETFDSKPSSTKLLNQISTGIFNVIKQSLFSASTNTENDVDSDSPQQAGGVHSFYCNGVWIPFVEHLTPKKTILLDSLERHEAGTVQNGYLLSRSCAIFSDLAQTSFATVDQLTEQEDASKATEGANIAKALFRSVFTDLLNGFTILLGASIEETVTDHLLCGVATLVTIGCKLEEARETCQAIYVLCCVSLPHSRYLAEYAGADKHWNVELLDGQSSCPLHQVVVTGTPCPSPVVSPEFWNHQLVLTSRNLQAARVLLGIVSSNCQSIHDLWYLTLTVCQHLSWLLNIRPSSSGLFIRDKSDTDQLPANSSVTVTTAAHNDVTIVASFFDKINLMSFSLNEDDLTKFFDALIRLSDEQIAVSATGRDCSYFALASLLRSSLCNLPRVTLLWNKITSHLIKVCGHNSSPMREWAATALTTLIRQTLKSRPSDNIEQYQNICLSTLRSMCTTSFPDVRKKQLECLMYIMQTEGAILQGDSWEIVIDIVSAVVHKENECDDVLVRQGYLGIRLISADFLQSLPFHCIGILVECISKYGQQLIDQNISLSALALMWTISDYVFRKSESVGPEQSEKVWIILYTCLSELCVDSRHSVRKSACQTLLQTVAAHGHALRPTTWSHMIWQIIMPLLDRVRVQTKNASTEKSTSSLIIHHSRDTEQKQWTETCINIFSAACKMFNAQRKVLLELEDFPSAWEALLSYIEWAACYENAELSLSSLKSFQEILLGRVSAQTLDMNTRDRSTSNPDQTGMEQVPNLPTAQWLESWNSWQRMSRGLAKLGSAAVQPNGASISGVYIPGPSHLTTLLHIFPPLFERISAHIDSQELSFEHLPSVLESLNNVPIPSEQAPFILPSTTSQLTPTQEAIIDALRSLYNEYISPHSRLRIVLPDHIRLLLKFSSTSHRSPRSAPPGKNFKDWALQCLIPFSETCLRMMTDVFVNTASFPEVVDSLVVVDIVQFLGEPLYAKYSALSINTWKLAASSLMAVLKAAIPIARNQASKFSPFWPVLCQTLEKFLFTPNVCVRLAADERKRDELMECQAIELVRVELLAYSSKLPESAVQRLIALLNKGSICQLDPTDVLDSHTQRSELARACFDALLSTSNDGDGSLGNVAVSSLLQRCTQVMANFVRDWNSSGDIRLPRTRISEITNALQAVESLIGRLIRDPTLTELYSQLVSLYPSVVDVVPCAHDDTQLQTQIVNTLKSYQSLLLLKVVPQFSS